MNEMWGGEWCVCFLLCSRVGTKMMAPICGLGFAWLELLYQCQGREHLSFLMYLSRLGAKGKGEGRGLKAVSNQHQKWSQTLSRMKFQRAGDSSPDKWKEPENEPLAEWRVWPWALCRSRHDDLLKK